MRTALDAVLSRGGGAASRAELLAVVSRAGLDDEIRRRQLVAVFPRAYARPWDVDEQAVRSSAALLSVGGQVALSHLSALAQWNLPVALPGPVHVTAYQPRHPRGVAGELVVHRTLRPLDAVLVGGLPTVRPEAAVVTSWPMQPGSQQRAPVIVASRRGLLDPDRILGAADAMWWVRNIRSLRQLVAKIVAGCESELELWGYDSVFDIAGLRDARRQQSIRVAGRTYRLDMAYEQERLAVELDGRAYHASPAQWERDIARDLALATLGWQTVRLSHARLTGDVAGCRRDVLAVRAARRHRLAG